MTVEEIKARTDLRDVLSERGIKVVRGMASCPFHHDKNPSMKVYKDGYRCFSCGDYGDVIQFVMKYDGVDFKTAYLSLGGTYEHTSDRDRKLSEIRRMNAKKERERVERADKIFKETLYRALTVCYYVSEIYEPFSDAWCDAMNLKQALFNVLDSIGEEVDKVSVFRKCKEFNGRFID